MPNPNDNVPPKKPAVPAKPGVPTGSPWFPASRSRPRPGCARTEASRRGTSRAGQKPATPPASNRLHLPPSSRPPAKPADGKPAAWAPADGTPAAKGVGKGDGKGEGKPAAKSAL
jgi:hypothetical protein